MIFLYTLLLVLFGLVKFLFERRAAFLEWRHSRVAGAVDKLLREAVFKGGNTSQLNPGKIAQRQYLLGLLVQKKDRLEAKHFAWQHAVDKLNNGLDRLRNWKGKKLPYTLGAIDVWLFLYVLDYLGMAEYVSARNLLQAITSVLAN